MESELVKEARRLVELDDFVKEHGWGAAMEDGEIVDEKFEDCKERLRTLIIEATEKKSDATEIPENDSGDTLEAEVARAVDFIVKEMKTEGFKKSGYVHLNLNLAKASPGEMWVHNDCAAEVARRFKAKGYHAHYNHSMIGPAYELVITRDRTNKDI